MIIYFKSFNKVNKKMGLRKKIKKFLYTRKFSKKNYIADISKKNILITGANSGIGLALTKRLLELDNKVLATYHKKSENLIDIKNENLITVKYDQSNLNDTEELEKKIKLISIDLIFNCAGVFGSSFEDQQIEKLDFNKFYEVLMINSISILKIIQIILNNKKFEKNIQSLVNISSDAGSIKLNNQGNAYMYRTSKTALNSITKNMSIDLNNRFKTTVFAIDPGNVQSGMNPGGIIKADVCANLIIDLMSSNIQSLNGKFINLLGKEIPW